jgi:hypothetical protein
MTGASLGRQVEVRAEKGRAAHSVVEWIANTVVEPDAKAPPGCPGGAYCPAHSPFCLRLRDQMRLKVSPSSTRLA